ncbi:MAG TPA: AAA family ATPase [Bacteroidales bacterium]|nr:AAA family ATPase [Bacteroidales bacterium]
MDNEIDIATLNQKIEAASSFIDLIQIELNKVIIGQKHMTDCLIMALLTKGHILLEGVPGLAKTLSIKSLASTMQGSFSRIQFTPDLLPADLIGTMIFSPRSEQFQVRQGPIFANFILADEINRAPAKVQSALLEAMQERQVTIGNETYPLPNPFIVMATENPLEQEGTYPLPEAQVDRFMMKVIVDYPQKNELKYIIDLNLKDQFPTINSVATPEQILNAQKLVLDVYMDEKIRNYIIDINYATIQPDAYRLPQYKNMVRYGASPRASIYMALAAKAYAFIHRRGYVIPEDVRAIAFDVLRHRIAMTYEAEAENISSDQFIADILNVIEVP